MRNEMLHPAAEEVEAYVAGSLPDADRAVLESHLVGCATCAAEVEEWRALFTALSELPYLEPSLGFADRVMAGVRVYRPWHLRIAALLQRIIPSSTGGWFILITLVSLPVLTMGSAITWLLSRPWISIESLWIFLTFHIEAFIVDLGRWAAVLLIESRPVLWMVDGFEQHLASMGASRVGLLAALGAIAIMLSIWTLYRNLFRNSARGGSHATT